MKSVHHTAASKKAMVISSPGSGKSTLFSQALASLRQVGIEVVETMSIAQLDGLSDQGLQWQQRGITLVVAAGGDGLVGGVIAHIVKSGLPLGIIPLGTANDIARSVGLPLDPQHAAEVIANGKIVELDLGLASPAEQTPHPSLSPTAPAIKATLPVDKQMFFAHALTVGVNVQFARLATSASLRQQYGPMTYPLAVLEALKNYQPINAILRFDGLVVHPAAASPPIICQEPVFLRCRIAQASVVNAPVFWGGLQAIVPGISFSDRLLDIVVVEDAPLEHILLRLGRFLSHPNQWRPAASDWHAKYPDLLSAQLTNIPGLHHVKARSVTIDGEGVRQDATLDGEVRGQTPIVARVADERVRLIIPASSTMS